MTKRHNLRLLWPFLLLILFVFFAQGVSQAKVYKPIQILLPGNWGGNLIELDHAARANPGLAWKLPDLIKGLRRNRSNDVLVLATGNTTSIFSQINLLDNGASSQELLNELSSEANAVGPDDLELFSAKRLPQHLKKMIWTNIDSEFRIFPGYSRQRAGGKNIWMFNFIGSEKLKHVEVQSWGQFKIDNPARAMRRISPAIKAEDYSLSLVQLAQQELEELIAQMQNLPGFHFIAQINAQNEVPKFSQTHGKQHKNVFTFSLKPGHDVLPTLNIFSKNNAPPRMTLRMLPLAKHSGHTETALFNMSLAQLRPVLNKTLRLITTRLQASTSAFTLDDRIHTRLIRSSTGADIAMIHPPEMLHFNDNVISVAQLLTRFPNERIREINLKGKTLLKFFEDLLAEWGSEKLVFSGLELHYFAGRLSSLKVKGQSVVPDKIYSIAGSEKTIFSVLKTETSADTALQPPTGLTLWKVWLNGFDSRTIKEEELINN